MKSFFKSVLSTTLGALIAVILSLILVPVIFAVIVAVVQGNSLEPIHKDSILHLHMKGHLAERHKPLDFSFLFGGNPFGEEDRTMGLFELNRAIDLAAKDPRFVGIYLEFGDLEAGWASCTALRRHLLDFQKSGKWIYAYGDRLNEKTYYLATAATQIFMQPNGNLEFNGLGVNGPYLKGLFEKLEIEPRIFRVGKFKAAVEPLIRDSMSEENRLQTKTLLDDVWSVAREAYAHTAKLTENQIDEIASGLKVTSAYDAKEHGLISETYFVDQVEELLAKKSVGEDEDLRLVTSSRLLRDAPHPGGRATKKIAVIFADGEIGSGSASMGQIGSESMRQDISDATADPDVVAIVLRVNSPGGDALASDVIWRELRVADESVPVVVSMGDVAASGGYYLAAAGRYVFAEPTTITGSIGVFGVLFGSEKFFKNKTGVRFDHVVTHAHAGMGDPNRPLDSTEAGAIQNDVERVYKRFLDVVFESRGFKSRAEVANLAEGRVWSGLKAKEIGLVDELGGLNQALSKAAEFAELGDKPYRIDIYPKDTEPFREIIDRMAGESVKTWLGPGAVSILNGVNTYKQLSNGFAAKSGVYTRLFGDINIQ
jgi:protease-4